MTECAPSTSSGRSSAAPCCSLRRRLQVGDKWAQKTVPALAQRSVSPVITAGSVPAWVGRGSRGATRSTTIQFGWRRHGPLLKWEKAAWRRQHGWRRVSSSDGAPRPPRASNSRPHPAPPYTYGNTDMCLSPLALSQVARHSPPTPPLWRSAAGSLTVAAAAPTTQAVRRASAAPMCDGASGVCTCVKAAARLVPAAAAGGSTLAGGWTCA